MNKTIEKIETYKAKEIAKALEKAKQGYEEAKDFYSDTGYDRYFHKMQKGWLLWIYRSSIPPRARILIP